MATNYMFPASMVGALENETVVLHKIFMMGHLDYVILNDKYFQKRSDSTVKAASVNCIKACKATIYLWGYYVSNIVPSGAYIYVNGSVVSSENATDFGTALGWHNGGNYISYTGNFKPGDYIEVVIMPNASFALVGDWLITLN